jgi:hypothetical protein
MELPPELKSPLLPDLSVDELDDNERSSGQSFFDNMLMLQRWSFDFSSSAGLFDWASKPPNTDMKGHWCFIAARNGALALRHYSESLAAARESLGQVSRWQEAIEDAILADVQQEFGKRFPGVEKMRTTLCTLSDSEAASHGKVSDCLFGHNYMSTANGRTVAYDLTFQNAAFLTDLTKKAYESLQPLYAEQI